MNIELKCTSCNKELEIVKVELAYSSITIRVGGCSQCCTDAHNEGYDEGFADGENKWKPD